MSNCKHEFESDGGSCVHCHKTWTDLMEEKIEKETKKYEEVHSFEEAITKDFEKTEGNSND